MSKVAKKVANLSIGEQSLVKYRDSFVIDIKFMHGDADGYEYERVVMSEADEVMELLNFLERCAVRYPRGKGGCDDYTDVEGYSRFVEHYDDEEEEDEDFRPITQISWPYWDGQYCSSYKGYTVSYFDQDGKEFQVKLEFTK